MSGGAFALLLMLMLPVAALAARRLPMGQLATMALAWVGIFAIGIVIVSVVSQNGALTNGINSVVYGDSVTGSETRIAMGKRTHIASLKVGSVNASGLSAIVMEDMDGQDLLGMNFLSQLKSWRVEDRTLILVPASK